MSERKISLITNIAYILIAFAVGVALSVQAAANGQLAVAMGGNTLAAAFYSFLTGTIVLTVIAVLNGNLTSALSVLPKQPWGHLTRRTARRSRNFRYDSARASNWIGEPACSGDRRAIAVVARYGPFRDTGRRRATSFRDKDNRRTGDDRGRALTLFGDRILDVMTVGLKHN